MDDETRRRCLEPFFTTKGERGTGLGLAMVYGVARRHNAEIEIDSVLRRGTTIRLKFAPAATPEPPLPSAPDVRPSSLHLLVVDDDPLLMKALQDALESQGHTVVTASGGQQAIDLFFQASMDGQEPFAAVITDLGMPHIDGRRVASAVKLAIACHARYSAHRLGPEARCGRRHTSRRRPVAQQTAKAA